MSYFMTWWVQAIDGQTVPVTWLGGGLPSNIQFLSEVGINDMFSHFVCIICQKWFYAQQCKTLKWLSQVLDAPNSPIFLLFNYVLFSTLSPSLFLSLLLSLILCVCVYVCVYECVCMCVSRLYTTGIKTHIDHLKTVSRFLLLKECTTRQVKKSFLWCESTPLVMARKARR